MASYGGVFDKNPSNSVEMASSNAKSNSIVDDEAGDEYHSAFKGHTKTDQQDMQRLGKVQELKVRHCLSLIRPH